MSIGGLFSSMSQMIWGTPAPKKEAETNSTHKQDDNGAAFLPQRSDSFERQQKSEQPTFKKKSYADAARKGLAPADLNNPDRPLIIKPKRIDKQQIDDWVQIEDLNRTDDV